MVNGPAVVSPPTNATPCVSARSNKPAEKRSSHAPSADGNVNASVAQAGVAPMAAMSLKLTASARWPIERASQSAMKCRPATSVSTAATKSAPAGTRNSAASSPMPKITSVRFPAADFDREK